MWAQVSLFELISVLTWQDLMVTFGLLINSGILFLNLHQRLTSLFRSTLVTLVFWSVESAVVLSIRHYLGHSQK